MKYNLYKEIPENEKKFISGQGIKWKAETYDMEIYMIKDNKCNHKVYYPYEELDDYIFYKVYEDIYTAGSGISYGKIFIYLD